MKAHVAVIPVWMGLLAAGAGLAGCQSERHAMVEPKSGTVITCKACYNEVYEVQHGVGSRSGRMITDTHTRHVCSECKTEMSISMENGTPMVRCAKCAPDGVACDKCLPPPGWTVPPESAPAR